MIKDIFAGIHDSVKKRKIILTIVASILLITAIVGIVVGVNSKSSNTNSDNSSEIKASTSHAIIKSSCSITLHRDLCYSTLSNNPEITKKVKTSKDVIELALNKTKEVIQRNHVGIKQKLSMRTSLSKREKIALQDCLELVADTLEELNKVVEYLETYPTKKRLRKHVDDIITLMSTTLTNQETCIDGFSHSKRDRKVRESLIDGEINGGKMCSNSLAMIKNMTDTDMANEVQIKGRKLVDEENDVKWPEWLSTRDRKLLQSGTVTPDVVVAADGSGDFTTVSAAVAAAPNRSTTRFVISIAAGVYRENVDIPSNKQNLMFIGAGRMSTIITASRSVGGGVTTFNSATVAAVGAGFLARDITFQNSAGPSNQQAVALRVGSDLSAFYRCGMIAYQDTLYVHSNRQFYVNCFIAGTVDFIFGNAAAVIQNCDIHARRPNPNQRNMVTAQGRSDPNQNTGIVIQKSRIGATADLLPVQASFPTYLGRPWRNFSRTVVMQSTISDVINPAGWFPWDGDFALATLYYGEYENTGDGADTSNRVTWPGYRVITNATEAQGFTAGNFIAGGNWLGDTGFPFSLGL
ncbi:pectinesterase inhibitor domain, Pectin lyase fold/virulence factor [Artemisia annua]|uniref:Pectinesterase n=1 Tax=Artemisia annua TaxID=35608 RepID=A0A2U1L686_ARTAN|nr:pectinesterase inhibitor domain, Pectin lyase fold/virulence factor [Artemisia annua]